MNITMTPRGPRYLGTGVGSLADSHAALIGEADDMPGFCQLSVFRTAHLAATLAHEDADEELANLSPQGHITCPLNSRWIHECVSSPAHAIQVTGHRWSRRCDSSVNVAGDELTTSIRLTCPRFGRLPDTVANRQILRSCRVSLVAARQDRLPQQSGLRRLLSTGYSPIKTP